MATEKEGVGDTSAVIDMAAMGDDSDYETSFADPQFSQTSDMTDGAARQRPGSDPDYVGEMKKEMAKNVTSYVWETGRQQARRAFSLYANIDILRPYFDVEPHEVRARLLMSLVPSKPSGTPQKVPRELYGPTMLIFTMIALLLFQMKTSGHAVQEGTLMGTAFGVCFGYWFGVSSLVWVLSYICNTHITMLQILSLLGYALFGHCVVVGMTTLFHTSHDHMFFYLVWAIFGGLSTLKMVSVLTSRTAGQTQRIIVCAAVATLHLCFLLYLHFAYHQIVEEISAVIDGNFGQPKNIPALDDTKNLVEKGVENGKPVVKLPDSVTKMNQVPAFHKDVKSNLPKPTQGVNKDVKSKHLEPTQGIKEGLKLPAQTIKPQEQLKQPVQGQQVQGQLKQPLQRNFKNDSNLAQPAKKDLENDPVKKPGVILNALNNDAGLPPANPVKA